MGPGEIREEGMTLYLVTWTVVGWGRYSKAFPRFEDARSWYDEMVMQDVTATIERLDD